MEIKAKRIKKLWMCAYIPCLCYSAEGTFYSKIISCFLAPYKKNSLYLQNFFRWRYPDRKPIRSLSFYRTYQYYIIIPELKRQCHIIKKCQKTFFCKVMFSTPRFKWFFTKSIFERRFFNLFKEIQLSTNECILLICSCFLIFQKFLQVL